MIRDAKKLRDLAEVIANPDLAEQFELRAAALEVSAKKPLRKSALKELRQGADGLAARLQELGQLKSAGEVIELAIALESYAQRLTEMVVEPEDQQSPARRKKARWGANPAPAKEPPIFQPPKK